MSLLNVTNLAVAHGPLQALWDISLKIEAGERIGLLGANGAGKSTTLGAIVGYYPTMGGRIEFDGRDVTHDAVPSRLARGIGLVPEGRRLFTEMTVASMTSAASPSTVEATATITPSLIATSPTNRGAPVPSTMVPPVIFRSNMAAA